MSVISWLAFTPSYTTLRGRQKRHPWRDRLGAHAFREGAPRSLCGYVERARVGGAADGVARRCFWCSRVAAGKSADLSESTTPTGWKAER